MAGAGAANLDQDLARPGLGHRHLTKLSRLLPCDKLECLQGRFSQSLIRSKSTSRCRGPRKTLLCRYGGGSTTSRGFSTRRRKVSNARFTSRRASGPPKQVWMPLPQPKCSLSRRSGSNWFGFGKLARVAVRGAVHEVDRRTLRDDRPTDLDVGGSAAAGKELDRRLMRRTSSMAPGNQLGPAAQQARRTRGSAARVSTQWEIVLTVES